MKKIYLITIFIPVALFLNCESTDYTVPFEPLNLNATVDTDYQVTLNWSDNSTNESGFKIERKTSNGTFYYINSIGANITSYVDNGLDIGTTYTYRVRAYNSNGNSLKYSNEVTVTTTNSTILVVTTAPITLITATNATGGGHVSSNNSDWKNTTRGVVWSTTPNPTVDLMTKTADGIGLGYFISKISGLTNSTTYFIRAFATNSKGTTYGKEYSFVATEPSSPITDIDGNTYSTINIGTQCWTQQNLNVSRYRNGDIIPHVSDAKEWANLTTGAWCYLDNDPANGSIYGKLYNWYAVNDPRGLAPEGWHVPSDTEWEILEYYLWGNFFSSAIAMESTTGWTNNLGTNTSGFTGLPGAYRWVDGSFPVHGGFGFWWSSTLDNTATYPAAWGWFLNLDYLGYSAPNLIYGLSVRCVKN